MGGEKSLTRGVGKGVGGQIAPPSDGVPHPPHLVVCLTPPPTCSTPPVVGHRLSNPACSGVDPAIFPPFLWVGRSLAVSVTVSMVCLSLIYQWYLEGKQGIRHPLMRLGPLWRHAIQPACPG